MGAFIKHKRLSCFALAAASLLGGCATMPPTADAPKIAITIDDLPVHGPMPRGVTALDVNRQMIRAIQEAGTQGVTVFINGHWLEGQPETAAALQAWDEAGIAVGSHSWSHPNLNNVTADQYKQEISRNEAVVERFADGKDWHWYRYPYLAEGEDLAKRVEIRNYLADRGYKIAGVSMDFSDWKWTAAYVRCANSNNAAAVKKLERMYLDAARFNVDYSRKVAKAIYGRDIPHVLLMHVSAFSARMMPRLLQLYRNAGFRFMSLAEAQADPAYAEDMNPRLPPRPQFVDQRPTANGVIVEPQSDYSAQLDAMCPGGPMTPTQ
ncbi:MAG: polysaccharide deacetylase family protein [Sphingomicrobium sp.]